MDDVTDQEALLVKQLSVNDEEDPLEFIDKSESSEKVKKVVIASVLASLSIAIAPIAEVLPRIPGWGIALFDPVSIFWIVSFLIGGIWVGLVSSIAGTMGLFLYDPTAIGPIMKLIATLPMIIIPWYGVRRLRNGVGGEALSDSKFFSKLMIIAFSVRLVFMIPINLIYGAFAYPFFTVDFIATYAIILNALQSFWDALIPYFIVHKTQVFKNFKMW